MCLKKSHSHSSLADGSSKLFAAEAKSNRTTRKRTAKRVSSDVHEIKADDLNCHMHRSVKGARAGPGRKSGPFRRSLSRGKKPADEPSGGRSADDGPGSKRGRSLPGLRSRIFSRFRRKGADAGRGVRGGDGCGSPGLSGLAPSGIGRMHFGEGGGRRKGRSGSRSRSSRSGSRGGSRSESVGSRASDPSERSRSSASKGSGAGGKKRAGPLRRSSGSPVRRPKGSNADPEKRGSRPPPPRERPRRERPPPKRAGLPSRPAPVPFAKPARKNSLGAVGSRARRHDPFNPAVGRNRSAPDPKAEKAKAERPREEGDGGKRKKKGGKRVGPDRVDGDAADERLPSKEKREPRRAAAAQPRSRSMPPPSARPFAFDSVSPECRRAVSPLPSVDSSWRCEAAKLSREVKEKYRKERERRGSRDAWDFDDECRFGEEDGSSPERNKSGPPKRRRKRGKDRRNENAPSRRLGDRRDPKSNRHRSKSCDSIFSSRGEKDRGDDRYAGALVPYRPSAARPPPRRRDLWEDELYDDDRLRSYDECETPDRDEGGSRDSDLTPESLTLQTSKYLSEEDDWEYGKEHDPVDSLESAGDGRGSSAKKVEGGSRRKDEARSRGRRRSKWDEAQPSEDYGVSLTVNDLEQDSIDNSTNDSSSSISGASAISKNQNSTNSKTNHSASAASFVPPLHSEVRANMPSATAPFTSKPVKKAPVRNSAAAASSLIRDDMDGNRSEVISEVTLPHELCKVPPFHSAIRAKKPSFMSKSSNGGIGSGVDHHVPLPDLKTPKHEEEQERQSMHYSEIAVCDATDVVSAVTMPSTLNAVRAPPLLSTVLKRKPSDKITSPGIGGEESHRHSQKTKWKPSDDTIPDSFVDENLATREPTVESYRRSHSHKTKHRPSEDTDTVPESFLDEATQEESYRHSRSQKSKWLSSEDYTIPDSFVEESLATTIEPPFESYRHSRRPSGDTTPESLLEESIATREPSLHIPQQHPQHLKTKLRSSCETPDSLLEENMATREPAHDNSRQHSQHQEYQPQHHAKPQLQQPQSAAKTPFFPRPPPPRPPPRPRLPKQSSSNAKISRQPPSSGAAHLANLRLQSQPLPPLREENCSPSPAKSCEIETSNSNSFELSDPMMALNDAAAQLLSLQSGGIFKPSPARKNDGFSPGPSPKTSKNMSLNYNQPVSAQLPFQTLSRRASLPTNTVSQQQPTQNLSRSLSQPTNSISNSALIQGLLNQGNQKARKSKVEQMPFTDDFGDSGLYTGEVNEDMRPNGSGKMKYDNGVFFDGKWKNGVREGALGQRERMLKGFSSWKGAGKGGKTVHGMSWIDRFGKTGQYTGDVNEQSEPHGKGIMRYDFGLIAEGEWVNGLLIDGPQPGSCMGGGATVMGQTVAGGMAGQAIVGGMPGQMVVGGMPNGTVFQGMGNMIVMNQGFPQSMMTSNMNISSIGNFAQGNMPGCQAGPPTFIGGRDSE